MTIKFPVSRRHIDAKGLLFKAKEDPASRKMTLKGYRDHQKATPGGPDQASICDELGERRVLVDALFLVKLEFVLFLAKRL